jgi:hypothetical protein
MGVHVALNQADRTNGTSGEEGNPRGRDVATASFLFVRPDPEIELVSFTPPLPEPFGDQGHEGPLLGKVLNREVFHRPDGTATVRGLADLLDADRHQGEPLVAPAASR